MSDDLIKRAEELDKMRSKGIAEKLTLEEAQNIVNIWGVHLEHAGMLRILFMAGIPESLLPYPIDIIQGALNKMEAYYWKQGQHDRVKLLEETEVLLVQYSHDEKAIKEFMSRFSDKKIMKVIIESIQKHQLSQAENGYLVDKNLWKLSKLRIEELEKE